MQLFFGGIRVKCIWKTLMKQWRKNGFVFHINNPEEIYFLVTKIPKLIVSFLNMQNCFNSKLASPSQQ